MTNSSLSSDTTGCLVTIKLQAHVYPNVKVIIIHEKPCRFLLILYDLTKNISSAEM